MRQQPERLELGQLAPHGRRRHVHARSLDERFRPDGLAGRDVLFDHPPQDLAPAGGELFHGRPIVPGSSGCERGGRRRSLRRRARVRDALERPLRLEPLAHGMPERLVECCAGLPAPRSGRTRRARSLGSVCVRGAHGIDVDAADHVALVRIEHRVGEPDALLEIARVHLEIGEVLRQPHLVRPRAPDEARRRPDVVDRRRPGGVVGLVVLRPERLQHELRRRRDRAAARSPRARTAAAASTDATIAARRRPRAAQRALGALRRAARGVRPPPRNRPRGVSESVSSPPAPRPDDHEPARDHPLERIAVDDRLEAGERQRLVEPEAEHDALLRLRQGVELLELARRIVAGRQRADVAADRGAVRRRTSPRVDTAPIPTPR